MLDTMSTEKKFIILPYSMHTGENLPKSAKATKQSQGYIALLTASIQIQMWAIIAVSLRVLLWNLLS